MQKKSSISSIEQQKKMQEMLNKSHLMMKQNRERKYGKLHPEIKEEENE